VRFWAGRAVVAVPGLAVLPFLPAAELAHTTGARVLAVATLTALAGAGLCRIGT